MKVKLDFKYIIYLVLISFLILIDLYLEKYAQKYVPQYILDNRQGSDPLGNYVYIARMIPCFCIGVVLGIDHFVSEIKKKGKLRVDIAKVIILGLPALYFSLAFITLYSSDRLRKIFFYLPRYLIKINGNMVFLIIFFILLGYIAITSFYKKDDCKIISIKSTLIKLMKYSTYLILIIGLLCLHIFIDMPYDKTDYFSYNRFFYLLTPLFYIAMGIIIGFDIFWQEAKKRGRWYVNWLQVLFLIVPSLYFSFAFFLHSIYIPLTLPINIIVRHISGNLIYISIFQIILGYQIMTCYHKKSSFEDANYHRTISFENS